MFLTNRYTFLSMAMLLIDCVLVSGMLTVCSGMFKLDHENLYFIFSLSLLIVSIKMLGFDKVLDKVKMMIIMIYNDIYYLIMIRNLLMYLVGLFYPLMDDFQYLKTLCVSLI